MLNRYRVRLVATAPLLVAALATHPVAGQIVAGPTTSQLLADTNVRVTIPIAADLGDTILGAYRLTFRWNPARFAFAGVSAGTFGSPVFNIDSAAGTAQFAAASATGASGQIVLGNVSLKVLAVEADSFTVAFAELRAARTFQDLLPLLTTTSMAFCKGLYYGDLNGDRVIDASDGGIVLMHSVGIDTTSAGVALDLTAGDTDGDGDVDPRDALGIVSRAALLDVPGFRVGRLFSPDCSRTPAASITLPVSVDLAPGDAFNVAAVVENAAGDVIGARGLRFTSSDTAVVVVSSNGVLTARAAGTATLTAAVAPGVSATSSVTVAARHVWRVDPTVAAGRSREIGSLLHPFSSIAQALERAADGDTISIAVALYNEPISTTKSLVFLGDSTAAGMPTISTPSRSVGSIQATGVFIQWLQFVESGFGLRIKADSVGLQSVVFRAIRGAALHVDSASRVGLNRVSVEGAVGTGIQVTRSRLVGIAGAKIRAIDDVIDSIGVRRVARGITVTGADSVLLFGSEIRAVAGIGVEFTDNIWVAVRSTNISNTGSEGVLVGSVTTLELTDVSVESAHEAGAVGATVKGAIFITRTDTATVDSSSVNDNPQGGLWFRDNQFVVVTNSEFSHNGIRSLYVDSGNTKVVIDTNQFTDNRGVGLYLGSSAATVVTGTHNSFLRNGTGILDSAALGSIFQSNDFVGNGFGVSNGGGTAIDVTNSWWNDVLGPRCFTSGCDVESTGDSVSTNVTFNPFVTAQVSPAPPSPAAIIGARLSAPMMPLRRAMAASWHSAREFVPRPAGAVAKPQEPQS